jgi:sn-glycerol 3-phosphate transport system ATP-binding protein
MSDVAIKEVHKSFGTTKVIIGLDLEINDGEFVVIVGKSGCGKSTLLRMIAGLESITSGEISISGSVVNNLEPKERDVAMVFQNYALYPHMTAFQNIGYALRIARRPKTEIRERVEWVARVLGIEDLMERKPSQMSGGQRQRVAMGRAIIRKPGVFLFDEPLSNLDAKLRNKMRVELKKLHNSLKATSIFVTHDQIEAMTMADKLVVMNVGIVEQIGTPREIYAYPNSTYVATFIGSPEMNLFQGSLSSDGKSINALNGEEFKLPYKVKSSQGQTVMVGIRPEHLALGPKVHGEYGLMAQIEYIEDLGASLVFHAKAGEQEFTILAQADIENPTNGDVFVQFLPSNLHFFDASNGLRIEVEEYN